MFYLADCFGMNPYDFFLDEDGVTIKNVADKHLKHDFEITYGEDTLRVDIKTDSGKWQQTGNIVLETHNPKKANKLGWFSTTKAHAICFCLLDDETKVPIQVIIAPMVSLKRLVQEKDYPSGRRLSKGSTGLYVPIRDVLKCKGCTMIKTIPQF